MTTKKKDEDEKLTRLSKQSITRQSDVGFMFCPRCGHVVHDGSPNSICPVCHYRFCPACSD